MIIEQRPSPNQEDRPGTGLVDFLILHYTGMRSAQEALDRLCDPAAKVSAHYCIDEDGRTWELVPESRRAWHAGVCYWDGITDINSRSIGIELVNPGHAFGYRPFPQAQIESLENLCRSVLERHNIAPQRILGHSDLAPLRKEDPGELFPWRRLAENGIGLWCDEPLDTDRDLVGVLQEIGYGYLDEDAGKVIAAFQRHWRPASVTGKDDPETRGLAAALLQRIEQSFA
ncbi:N-acetylmuramoyl-L-alanine amidase [Limibacillus sp. MBR-115]|jgi:N-acetylmuramoyl-L-alanine amidase|uniref:N-acetylmuramoyl-L-alanine amidase n=1 Tax=Limibacillus sp. MBR-115 TaxID=3156465 RepID=UPI0033944E18